jgi:hypothetical protein
MKAGHVMIDGMGLKVGYMAIDIRRLISAAASR